jgi:GT2 family glycosyltransferase
LDAQVTISVVIPHFNRAAELRTTLVALAQQTVPASAFEVIVVDDGSAETAVPRVDRSGFAYPIRMLGQANRGPGAARNRGASEACGSLLVLLDADMVPSPRLLRAYAECHASAPGAILVGRQQPYPGAYTALFDRTTGFERCRDLGPDSRTLEFYHVSGGNMSVARDAFESMGGFDQRLRMTEDTDFGYRAFREGVPIFYCPQAVGFHNHAKTFAERCAQVRQSARWTAQLLDIQPDVAGKLPIYRDIESVSWREDGIRLVGRKLGRRFLATRPVRAALEASIRWGERRSINERALASLYWKMLSAHRVLGYREGLRRTG